MCSAFSKASCRKSGLSAERCVGLEAYFAGVCICRICSCNCEQRPRYFNTKRASAKNVAAAMKMAAASSHFCHVLTAFGTCLKDNAMAHAASVAHIVMDGRRSQ